MIPVVFINCHSFPYMNLILNGKKIYETRSRDMLRSLVNQRVLIAETGNGEPVIRCYATILHGLKITSKNEWEKYRYLTRVPRNSEYDWKPDTRSRFIYELYNVQPVPFPFVLPARSVRHGRVWAEFNPANMIENDG